MGNLHLKVKSCRRFLVLTMRNVGSGRELLDGGAKQRSNMLTFWKSIWCPHIRRISHKATGRSFELLTVNALNRYHFEVWLCGGSRDRGIDFRGVWKLNSRTVNILGQCKCYKRRIGPVYVRELEGAISHEHQSSLALLVINSGFTKDAYKHFMSSSYPLALTVLDTTFLHYCSEEMLPTGKTELLHTTYFNKNNLNLDDKRDKVCSQQEPGVNASDQENAKQMLQIKKEVLSLPQLHNSQDLEGGNISLFELNITARQLLPEIVIGRSLKKPDHPFLLLQEGSSVKNV